MEVEQEPLTAYVDTDWTAILVGLAAVLLLVVVVILLVRAARSSR